ncbi:amidohydrolase [soil metagenome]
MSVEASDDEQSLLVTAERVRTLAASRSAHEPRAVLLRGGRVHALGQPDELRAMAPHAPTMDLPGATITPGLTDAHIHLTEWAFARREIDLTAMSSPGMAARAVGAHAAASASRWIRGRGWNPHLWAGELPDRRVLDEQTGDKPVALQSHDMHALWVNSAALRAAGIDAATSDPDGGHIVRDEQGQPTGLLLEWAGQLVTRVFPVPSLEDAIAAVRDAQDELHSRGITGVHSFPGVHLTEPDPLRVLNALHQQGELRLRVLQHIRADLLDHVIALGLRSGFGDEWLRIGAVKMFLDGALGSRTAWMREPYEDGSGCGMNTLDPALFRSTVRRAAEAGIATTVHAIGDAAACLALDVLAEPAVRVATMPHRIEHLQCCPVDRLGDAAAAGVVCSMQPSHLMTDWSISDRYWGPRRGAGAFALASLLRSGTMLAFGSDAPVEPVDPRRGLFAAVMRQDDEGLPAAGWFPGERIEAAEALLGYTVGPARAAGLPAPAGSLAVGAPADLVAWDTDPVLQTGALPRMSCVAAIVGGVVVHTC